MRARAVRVGVGVGGFHQLVTGEVTLVEARGKWRREGGREGKGAKSPKWSALFRCSEGRRN